MLIVLETGILVPVSARADKVLIDQVMAVVNHHMITKSELDRSLAPTFKKLHTRFRGTAYKELVASLEYKLLMKKINERLELEEAERQGLTLTDDELDRAIESIMQKNNFTEKWQLKSALAEQGMTFRRYRQQLRKQMTIMKLMNQEVRSTVVISPDEVRQYYLAHRNKYQLPPHVTLADIFLKIPAGSSLDQIKQIQGRGEHIIRQLKRGDDFVILAGSESEGPNAENGGSLGDLTKDQLLPELVAPAFSIPVGQISNLIRSENGFYIIKVLKRDDHAYRRFKDLKDQILNDLTKKTTEKRIRIWLEKLRAKSYVVIYAQPPSGEKKV
ncbi:MAG: SurA N-terminal domain-containing protein [Leptospirales bacterium]